jgi:hypothetical protein
MIDFGRRLPRYGARLDESSHHFRVPIRPPRLPRRRVRGPSQRARVAPSADRAVAGCLRATGAPGGLAALGPYSRSDSATDLLTVGADGSRLAERVSVGRLLDCGQMTALRLTVLILLVAAPAAQAAPLAELPYEPLPQRAVATCLRATGSPGALAMFGPIAGRSSATDLLAAGAGGTTRTDRVDFGSLVDCAAVATAPGGVAVVAGAVAPSPTRVEVRAVVREPGGAFGAPATLGAAAFDGSAVTAAVSPSGHAVVAWLQGRGGGRFRIVAARRMPGGGFGPFQRLTPWRRGREFAGVQVTAGVDAAGVATVAWTRPSVRGRVVESGEAVVETATAGPAAAFVVQRLANRALDGTEVALAVAPDGWAVLAHAGTGGLRAYERAPGASGFGVAFRGGVAEDGAPTVAVRDGGGAVVAWRQGSPPEVASVEMTARPAAGDFPEASTVAPLGRGDGNLGFSVAGGSAGPFAPPDEGNWTLRSALAPGGRVLLAWGGSRTRRGDGNLIARVAAGSLAGQFDAPQRLGSPIRDINGLAPLFLPDGRAALAWTDNAGRFAAAAGTGRLHLAVESAPPAPEPALPALRVRARATQRLFGAQSVRVSASCDRACDVRARLLGDSFSDRSSTRSLLRAGTARLSLGGPDNNLGPARGRLSLVVEAAAPGGQEFVTRTERVHVIRRPALRAPPPLGVTARRRGSAIVVSWHTASPARRASYVVAAHPSRANSGRYVRERFAFTRGRGRTRFTLRLRPPRPDSLHWVTVQGQSIDDGRVTREAGASVPPV